MKLNYECMRDCLVYFEKAQKVELLDNHHSITLIDIPFSMFCNSGILDQYSIEEIFYTLIQLQKANVIEFGRIKWHQGRIDDFDVHDITPKGHEFLANIRSRKVRNLMKNLGKVKDEVSIDLIIKAASDLAYNLVLLSADSKDEEKED